MLGVAIDVEQRKGVIIVARVQLLSTFHIFHSKPDEKGKNCRKKQIKELDGLFQTQVSSKYDSSRGRVTQNVSPNVKYML